MRKRKGIIMKTNVEIYQSIRKIWDINPIIKIVESKKKYGKKDRRKNKVKDY